MEDLNKRKKRSQYDADLEEALALSKQEYEVSCTAKGCLQRTHQWLHHVNWEDRLVFSVDVMQPLMASVWKSFVSTTFSKLYRSSALSRNYLSAG